MKVALALLIIAFLAVRSSAQLVPFSGGVYYLEIPDGENGIPVSPNSTFIPSGQLWVRGANIQTTNNGLAHLSVLNFNNGPNGVGGLQDIVIVTGALACDQETGGLIYTVTQCNDTFKNGFNLCSSGFIQQLFGGYKKGWPFGTGVSDTGHPAISFQAGFAGLVWPSTWECTSGCTAGTSQCTLINGGGGGGSGSGTVTSLASATGVCLSPGTITTSGSVGLCTVGTAGSCTNCEVTFNAYGQATSYSTGPGIRQTSSDTAAGSSSYPNAGDYDNTVFGAAIMGSANPSGPGCTGQCARENSGFGVTALNFLTTGSSNVALGFGTLATLTTGNENLAVGFQAANENIVTGSDNVFVGTQSGASGDYSSCLVLGAQAECDTNNQFVLASANSPVLTYTNVGAAGAASVLPTNPLGYLSVKLNGAIVQIPFYQHA